MVNRRKRLQKGIESIEEQIEIHEQKKTEAEKEGNYERVEYYDKEIESFRKNKEKKEGQLEK